MQWFCFLQLVESSLGTWKYLQMQLVPLFEAAYGTSCAAWDQALHWGYLTMGNDTR